eukprot:TRINITY_DN71019_c0_g1_i1.p2 TRINITY_DN71019_c0_g1~~TRINITY_DN71019_c0_g1_i1.p2  ORF type:complete len:389 (+),score=166.16 TRINITY_DN71019_c0_g1_i1:78-1169(+)
MAKGGGSRRPGTKGGGGGGPRKAKGGKRKKGKAGGASSTPRDTGGLVRKPADAPESELAPAPNVSGSKRNKMARSRYYEQFKMERAVRKMARQERRKRIEAELGPDAPPKPVPKTIDNMRPVEDTFMSSGDEEMAADEADDEFAEFYQEGVEPRLLITTQVDSCWRTRAFCQELLSLFPNSEYFHRQKYTVRQVTQYAVNRGYTDMLVIGDSGGGQKQRPYLLVLQHLPQGPTSVFRISSVRFHAELKDTAPRSEHYPELILKNFTTRLGRRLKRQFEALFPQQRDYRGRAVATFQNHRDFIFVRLHRYIFDGTDKVRIQEMGPRFTLRLRSLQAGLFDPALGDYEWFRKKREMDRERRRFHL